MMKGNSVLEACHLVPRKGFCGGSSGIRCVVLMSQKALD
jgi:hypothetical protein